ncbi:MAG: thiamine-monophosphate kinase [Planctomycetes bacterium]|nr:thiamine-monophosphate kinase [Planctomycetota bacterium]
MDRPEFALIDWIRSRVTDRDPVKLGIGDDAAVLRSDTGRDWLVATDMLMEGVDFTFPPATAPLVGRKSLAVNLSDIAAMGGRPTAAFVSVALPIDRGVEFARDLHAGLLDLANQYGVVLAGGDTNSWDGQLVINVAVVGEPFGERSITRRGALPGDWIFVTGALGGSIHGRHLTFEPRVRESKLLTELVNIHAMIDISDGLAADLHHILEQSRVGAIVDASAIPLHADLAQSRDDRGPVRHALSDGEDFELVFTVSSTDGQRLIQEWHDSTPIQCIGEITAAPECWLRTPANSLVPLPPLGWTHPLDGGDLIEASSHTDP